MLILNRTRSGFVDLPADASELGVDVVSAEIADVRRVISGVDSFRGGKYRSDKPVIIADTVLDLELRRLLLTVEG